MVSNYSVSEETRKLIAMRKHNIRRTKPTSISKLERTSSFDLRMNCQKRNQSRDILPMLRYLTLGGAKGLFVIHMPSGGFHLIRPNFVNKSGFIDICGLHISNYCHRKEPIRGKCLI